MARLGWQACLAPIALLGRSRQGCQNILRVAPDHEPANRATVHHYRGSDNGRAAALVGGMEGQLSLWARRISGDLALPIRGLRQGIRLKVLTIQSLTAA